MTSEEPSATEAPSKPAPRTLCEIVTQHLEALRTHHAGVIETEDVEAIHRTRVTTRRLQAAIDLLQTGRLKSQIRQLKKRLRNWRRSLSLIRNYDVFLQLLEKESSTRRGVQREQFELAKAILLKRRSAQAAKVRRKLERINVSNIAAKLGVTLSEAPSEVVVEQESSMGDTAAAQVEASEASEADACADPAPDSKTDLESAPYPEAEQGQKGGSGDSSVFAYEAAFVTRAADRIEQRLAEFLALAAQSHPTTNPEEVHQLRIAAKRLRYLLETTSEMGYGDASGSLTYLKALQDRIGEWHDLEALEAEIIGVVGRRKFLRENLAESADLMRAAWHLQRKKQALVARLFPVRVPKSLAVTSLRFGRALRRSAASIAKQPATTNQS